MKALIYSSAFRLSQQLQNREISSEELAKALIERQKQVEPKIKAFLSFNENSILEQAKASDLRRKQSKILGPLDGIPVILKDVIAEENAPLTCGSRILEHYVSPYSATVVEKLKSMGALLFGHTNLDEFAMGSSTENSAFQTTANPWDLSRVPGGSSGGSAAAVAAGICPLALGSDTGGSIRQPAALCGIVGLKPTYGRVSRYGLAAYASSLDQIGPMARSVKDIALLLQAISGPDNKDATSIRQEVPNFLEELQSLQKSKRWKIGLPKEYFQEGLDSEVRQAIERAIQFYTNLGCEFQEIALPLTEYSIPVYYIVATAEAFSNLARYDGIRYTKRTGSPNNLAEVYEKSRDDGFGPEVKRRLLLGSYALSSECYEDRYIKAQKVRALLRQDFLKNFEKVDVLFSPTTPTVAFKIGENIKDPLAMYLNDVYTIAVNLAGLPAISIPCGFNSEQLPIGLQLIGKPFHESDLLALAEIFESAHSFFSQTPIL